MTRQSSDQVLGAQEEDQWSGFPPWLQLFGSSLLRIERSDHEGVEGGWQGLQGGDRVDVQRAQQWSSRSGSASLRKLCSHLHYGWPLVLCIDQPPVVHQDDAARLQVIPQSLLCIDVRCDVLYFRSDVTLHCGAFHPDGLLFALGDQQGAIQLW